MTASLLSSRAPVSSPLVVTPAVAAHRGASGYRPEHTLEAFRVGMAQGADDVELDLVATRDGVLVVRHDLELSRTTDVATRPELASRHTTKVVDGEPVTGWFVQDLDLAELRTLTARERMPRARAGSAAHDGRHRVATFEEVVRLVRAESAVHGRSVGVLAELKHAAHHQAAGLPLDALVHDTLRRLGLDHDRSRVSVMAFEDEVLRRLAGQVRVPLVQLVDRREQVTRARLAGIAAYADGIGARKDLLLREGLGRRLVRRAHREWLTVHAWTLRAENRFLGRAFRSGEGGRRHGDLAAETRHLLDLGVDGLITDHPDRVAGARDTWVAHSSGISSQPTT
ncbi:glycerophosphodiester phosphodiesterase family protein [Nocardioides ungokensis]|uniref:glycerophosphodiester phosphodiesterase family protein n=1 Tax=Nocardioides ungokensis TaxID=1643322 RepID=UPI001FE4ED94|nr:glycerophosphodiester phosphodiesterase family protein [Nocardioides ungokensis]